MVLSLALLVTVIVVVAIYFLVEIKRLKHKLFAFFLIIMILLFYVSMFYTFKGQEVDLKTYEGIKEASTIYMTYLGSIFKNLKTITANAINLDWSANKSLNPNILS